jgi:hypothetical protein
MARILSNGPEILHFVQDDIRKVSTRTWYNIKGYYAEILRRKFTGGMPGRLRGMLYRPFYLVAYTGNAARQTRRGALR